MIRIGTRAACLLLALAAAAAPAAHAPVRARSGAILATLFTVMDYPADAIRKGEQGPVGFRLEVGADGRPAGCAVTASSGSASLDSTTCRLLIERARFEPARDETGKPTTDSFNGRIVWRLDNRATDRKDAAFTLWGACLLGEAAKLASTGLDAAGLARKAFPSCAALEAVAERELGDPAALEARRGELVGAVETMIVPARAALSGPPQAAAPKP
jgi:TonB family protein